MERYGISVNLKNIPELDPEFMPLARYNEAFLENATKPISIAVERADGQMAACHTKIHESADMKDANNYYIDRLVKTMLWLQGGFRVYVAGDKDVYEYLHATYNKGGAREFDWNFMSNVFEHAFEVVYTDNIPEAKDFIAAGYAGGGMLPKLNNCIDAIEHGVNKVHILDGRVPHSVLLEIFTDKGVGTAILNDSGQNMYYGV